MLRVCAASIAYTWCVHLVWSVESTASQLFCVLRVLRHTWAMRLECCVTPGLLSTCLVPWEVSAVLDHDSEEGDQAELKHHHIDTVAAPRCKYTQPVVKCARCQCLVG